MDTLKDVRRDVAKFVGDSGACATDARVLTAINDARRLLYPLGSWINITDPLCIRAYAGAFTLPSYYDYAVKAYNCREKLAVQNDWFTPVYGDFSSLCGSSINPLVKQPGNFGGFRDWPCMPRGKCGADCPPEGFYMAIQLEDERDCGVELTFHGIGAVVRQVSLTRTITTLPFVSSLAAPGEPRMVKIEQVIKPETNGRIRVYGYDGANTLLLALYEPRDVNPSYTRYGGCNGRSFVMLKAKKKYVPLTDDKQFVDIHTEALIHALQAITERESRNIAGFNANMQMAVAFLNRELQGPESTATYPMRMSHAYKVEGLVR